MLSGKVSFLGKPVAEFSVTGSDGKAAIVLSLGEPDFVDELHYWTPENPNLYDMTLRLSSENDLDTVDTYFGMRSLSAEDGVLYLNHRPYYQRLVLDQGYWRESLMTSPMQTLCGGLEYIKAMGV